jgi:hypothetical protein
LTVAEPLDIVSDYLRFASHSTFEVWRWIDA